MYKNSFRNLVVACAAGISSLAFAAPVPSDLLIFGEVSMDPLNSELSIGNSFQGGMLSGTLDGVPSLSNFPGNPALTSPISGALVQINDGLGAVFAISGAFDSADATSGAIFADFSFSLNNLSATLTYTLIFQVSASNLVKATGPDAFAESSISVMNSALDELFFSDFSADSFNLGPANNFQEASPLNTFAITLLPNQSASFTALQRQRGGAFEAGSSYEASLTSFIKLQEVRSSGGGGDNQVPTPGSLALLLAGVAALSLTRRAACH